MIIDESEILLGKSTRILIQKYEYNGSIAIKLAQQTKVNDEWIWTRKQLNIRIDLVRDKLIPDLHKYCDI
jgi:hypothetical protein